MSRLAEQAGHGLNNIDWVVKLSLKCFLVMQPILMLVEGSYKLWIKK